MGIYTSTTQLFITHLTMASQIPCSSWLSWPTTNSFIVFHMMPYGVDYPFG